MEISTFYMSPSTPFLKPQKPPNQIFTCKLNAHFQHFAFHRPIYCSIQKTSSSISSPSFSSFNRNTYRFALLKVRAVTENAEGSEGSKPRELAQTLQLGAMFGTWYLLNIYYNIYNKQVLKVFPFPATVTAFQFGCGTMLILFMWGFRLHPKPKISKSQVILSPRLCFLFYVGCI